MKIKWTIAKSVWYSNEIYNNAIGQHHFIHFGETMKCKKIAFPITGRVDKMKKILFVVLVFTLTLGFSWQASTVFAAFDHGHVWSPNQNSDKEKEKGIYFKSEALIKMEARELGIETKGKDPEALAKEIFEARITNAATELGIEIEGREMRDIIKEVHHMKVIKKAKELGIKADGKEAKSLAKEVHEGMVKQKAAELGIVTEGKEFKTIKKEVFEKRIKNAADELDIATNGKDLGELKSEIRDAKILQTADKLGVSTENKDTEQLLDEIIADHAVEAKRLELFPFEKHEFRMHHGSKLFSM